MFNITKTFYVDMTDLLVYLERILPSLMEAASLDRHSHISFDCNYRAVDIVDEFLAIQMLATHDIADKQHRLQTILQGYYPLVGNMLLGKLNTVFGHLDDKQFQDIAQYISYSFAGFGVVFTIPTAEWLGVES